MEPMGELARTALAIERGLLEKFDKWITAHGYANRSKAVRDLIRGALVETEWADPNAKVVGALSIIYGHAQRALAQELTQLQHEDHHAILCSQHVHLDEDRCMETILMRGTAGQLRRLADTIIAQRGVKFGKLTLMSTNI
jgi:CopG family nickel-responsive transcriptional regulator